MTQIQFDNEAARGLGACPGCGGAIHIVASAAERRLRWCCLRCKTVGSAPYAPRGLGGSAEGEDESSAVVH
jgi:hypothetical protein